MAARLTLRDEDFHAGSASALEGELTRRIEEDELGTAIFLPKTVEVPPASDALSVPLLGVHVSTLRDACLRAPLTEAAVVVASHLETGRAYAERAFPFGDELRPPVPRTDPGPGVTGRTFRIDAAARLGLPARPGTYAVWLLLRDAKAGPARVALVPPPSAPHDPEVARFIGEWRRTHARPPGPVSPPAVPGTLYPTYAAIGASPPLPREPGIALSVPRAIVLDESDGCLLAGSFKLAVRPRHLVPKEPGKAPGERAGAAVVPITLILTADDFAGPLVVPLNVPATGPETSGEAVMVTGHFALDLFMFDSMWRTPRTFYVYALHGEVLSAPAPCTLLSAEGIAEDP